MKLRGPGVALCVGLGGLCLLPGALPSASGADPPPKKRARATFAGGCFWCMEAPFDKIPGVVSTDVGLCRRDRSRTRRTTRSPRGRPGTPRSSRSSTIHGKVAYERLLEVFWRNIDPFDGGGQFCDRGSAVPLGDLLTTSDDAEAGRSRILEAALEAVGPLPAPIVTEIVTVSRPSTRPRSITRTTTRRTSASTGPTDRAAGATSDCECCGARPTIDRGEGLGTRGP